MFVPVTAPLDACTAIVPVSATSELDATTVFPEARFALVGPQRETLRLFPSSPANLPAKGPADVICPACPSS